MPLKHPINPDKNPFTHIIEIAPTSEGEGYFDRWTVTSSAIEVKNNYYEANMTQATDTDIREIRTAVESIAKATEANTKAIADLTLEMRLGFADIKGEFKEVRGLINTVEAKLEGKIDKLDERTQLGFWGFIFRGTALAALAALTAIFVKYLFPILPPELPRM
ncbi:hypothetical protein [Chamaesiphon sp.]|uniref:hypothetical protein n=1 Tax=Chamaesiphon sp. TaxID=2814140 RepID=UPI0035944B7C